MSAGVLKLRLALSRQPGVPKTYVQQIVQSDPEVQRLMYGLSGLPKIYA